MPKYDYDLLVIGGGSGGIRAARWSAQLGAKVALCEKDRLGGTCVIRGCIPKKLMVYAAAFTKDCEVARSYGWDLKKPELDWEKFNQTRHREIARLEKVYSHILETHNVDLIPGQGVLKDSHTVDIEGRLLTAKYILIAVGGAPYKLPIEGSEFGITSDEIFSLKNPPKSLLVLGAGYIGLEFASIFRGLGVEVSLMFRKEYILSGFDLDIRKHLQKELEKKNILMLSKRNPLQMEKSDNAIIVRDDKRGIWQGDLVLMATGRQANTKNLNLPALGIQTDGSKILVNKALQTTCPSVFAIGDCTNRPWELTPVALHEGVFVSEHLFSQKKSKEDLCYENIPSVVWAEPPLGTVGWSEEQALEKGFSVKVYESQFRPLKFSLGQFPEKTYMKLVVCRKTDRVLGCHIVGDGAGEILQGFAVAIRNQLKKSDWDKTIGIHPSSAEELVTMRKARD